MPLSERLLVFLRNLAAAYFFSGFGLFLVGWAYGLPSWVVFGIPSVAYLAAFCGSHSALNNFRLKQFRISLRQLPRIAIAVIFLFLILNFLFCLLPPAENLELDALNYHFVIPWQYYLRGAVVEIDWSVADKYPLYFQMAQLPFTVAGFPWVIKAGNILALPLLLVAVWHFCRFMELSQKNTAWTVALLSSLALYVKQYGTAMFDLINGAYCLLAFLYLFRATLSKQNKELLWGAIFLGMLCAAKTFYIYYAVVWFLAVILWKLFLQRQKLSKFDFVLATSPLMAAMFFLSFVWVRNVLLTGNPFYPLFLQWFGPIIENEGFHLIVRHVAEAGYGHSALDILLLPFRLILPFPQKFGSWTDPILLIFLASGLVTIRRRRYETHGLVGLILVFLYAAFFFTGQQDRYLYPFWALVTAVGAPIIFHYIKPKLRGTAFVVQVIIGVFSFLFYHRQALTWLSQGPASQYLSRASHSFVWNKEVEDKNIKQLCLPHVGTPTLHINIYDILYFTLPVKHIQHFHSTMSMKNPKAAEGCDAFLIGDQKRNAPPHKPTLVPTETFLTNWAKGSYDSAK